MSMSKFASQKDYWEARAKQAEAQRDELVNALRNARGFIHLYDKGVMLHEGGLLAEIDAVLSTNTSTQTL